MKLRLKQFAAASDRTRQDIRREIVQRFELTDQQFDTWWMRDSPVITIELDPRTFRIKALWKGEAVLVPEREL